MRLIPLAVINLLKDPAKQISERLNALKVGTDAQADVWRYGQSEMQSNDNRVLESDDLCQRVHESGDQLSQDPAIPYRPSQTGAVSEHTSD